MPVQMDQKLGKDKYNMADNKDTVTEHVIAVVIGLKYSSSAFSTRLAVEEGGDIIYQTWNSDSMPFKTATTPTAILFDENFKFHSYGYEAREAYDGLILDGNHRNGFYFTEFTKALIHQETNMTVTDIRGKTVPAEEVFSAAVMYFKTHYENRLSWLQNCRWIFTTPMALDKESYRNLLTKAAVLAGIDATQVTVVPEAEAYVRYYELKSSEEFILRRNVRCAKTETETAVTNFAAIDVNDQSICATIYSRENETDYKELCKVMFGSTRQTFLEDECLEIFHAICGKSVFQKYCELYPNQRSLLKSKLRTYMYVPIPEFICVRLPFHLDQFYESETGKCFERNLMIPVLNKEIVLTRNRIRFEKKTVLSLLQQGMKKNLSCLQGLMKMPDVKGTNTLLLYGTFSTSNVFLDAVSESLPTANVFSPFDDSNMAILRGAVLYGIKQGTYMPIIQAKIIKHLQSDIPHELLQMSQTSVEFYRKALAEGSEAAHNIRVMVVGHFGVGKTTLTRRLFGESVDLSRQESTEGIDVHVRKCKVSLEDGQWHVLDEVDRKNDTYKRLAKLCNANSTGRTKETDNTLDEDAGSVQHNGDTTDKSASQDGENLENGRSLKSEHDTDTFEVGMKATFQDQDIELYPKDEHAFRPSSITEVCPTTQYQFQTSDDIFQDLKEIAAEAWDLSSDVRPTEMADVSVWDFAGQFAFYSTHQVFLSRRAIYLLVINLSKSIDDDVPDKCFMDSRGSRHCHVADFVEFWLNSIHEYCGGPESERTPVILVGTFADKIDQSRQQEIAKAYFRKLKRKLVQSETFEHLAEEMIIIDNSIVDPNFDILKTTIWKLASKQSYWGELIPANYITLEKTLMELRNEGLKVLLKQDLREINKAMPVPVASDEGLEVFLNFQHETGYLLYFDDAILKDYVLLEPQWLIDAFKCLITADIFCKRRVMYKMWLDFDEKGILTSELIDMAWREADDGFYKHRVVLLLFMEKLGLIAKPFESTEHGSSQTEERHYFAPCVLKDEPPLEVIETKDTSVSTTTSRICFTTASRFIPSAVFNKLLAACLVKWQLVEQNETPMLFCGFGVFKIDETHFLYVYFLDSIIQIWITRFSQNSPYPEREICEVVKNFVITYLRTNTRMSSKIDEFVKCPREHPLSNKALYRCKELLEKPEVTCCFHGEPHSISSSEMTKYWYGNQQVAGSAIGARIELDVLDRLPTDMEINRIAQKIGKNYQSLGRELGLTQTEIDRIEMDYGTSLNRINGMLIQWRSKASDEATYRNLKQAMHATGMADIFCVSGDTP